MREKIYAHHIDILSRTPALEVPVFFLIGKNDYNAQYELVKEYYETLEALRKISSFAMFRKAG